MLEVQCVLTHRLEEVLQHATHFVLVDIAGRLFATVRLLYPGGAVMAVCSYRIGGIRGMGFTPESPQLYARCLKRAKVKESQKKSHLPTQVC